MIKKIAAVLLAVLMISTVAMPTQASTQAVVTYTVGSVVHEGAVEAGETVTIPVTVSSSSPLCAMQLSLRFDPAKWEVTEGKALEFLQKNFSFFEVNIAPIDNETHELIPGKVNIGGMAMKDTAAPIDAPIAQITLRALCTIDSDETVVIEEVTAAKAPVTQLSCEGVNGMVRIQKAAVEKGDVNLDGTVSLSDATQLFYVVNGMMMLDAQQQEQADLNGDGAVMLTDATQLFYYVNGLTE